MHYMLLTLIRLNCENLQGSKISRVKQVVLLFHEYYTRPYKM